MNSQPIRILRVVGWMDRGGLETVIMNSYRITDRSKIQYDFVVHTDRKCMYDDEIEQLGGKIYHMPRYIYINHRSYCKAWKNFFFEHPEYKIIHGHMRSTAAIYLKIAKENGLVTISHSHGVSSGYGIQGIIKDWIQKGIPEYSDYMLACSLKAGEWLFGKKNTMKNNFKVLKNGIDSDKFRYSQKTRDNMRKKLGIDDKIIIGHVGRFDEAKNQIFLIDLISEIITQNQNYILMLVGTGENIQKIKEEIKRRKIEKYILMLGSRDDIAQLMQAMDIFVFPSKYEGFGNVVVEAQAAGLPCVISTCVPKDVMITDLVLRMDLSSSKKEWIKVIESKLENFQRKDCIDQIIEAGYDVHQLTEWYEEFYLNCGQKNYLLK